MQHEQKTLKETLQPILSVLNDLGGKFSFTDEEGNSFVLASQEVFAGEGKKQQEQQLPLPKADTVSRAIRKHIDHLLEDDVLDRINRDIALAYALKQELEEEEVLEDLDESSDDDVLFTPKISTNPETAHDSRIRFEPLKGDLPPELQE